MKVQYLIKLAAEDKPDIGYGDFIGTRIGSTVGRINNYLNPLSAFQLLTISPRMILNPSSGDYASLGVNKKDRKGKMYETLMKLMRDQNIKQLSDVRVNLGGPRYFNDLKRTFTNSRTFPLLRPLYALATPMLDFTANIARADHYNPLNNTVTLYSDNPAILTHELGHAIDINSWGLGGARNKEKEQKQSVLRRAVTKIKRHILNLPRDAYSLVTSVLGNKKAKYYNPAGAAATTLWMEAMANTRSLMNIRKALKDNPEALKNLYTLRNKTLLPAYSTYLLGAAGPIAGMGLDLNKVVGTMLGAKAVGEVANAATGNLKTEYRAYHDFMDALIGKEEATEKSKSKVKEKKPVKAVVYGA